MRGLQARPSVRPGGLLLTNLAVIFLTFISDIPRRWPSGQSRDQGQLGSLSPDPCCGWGQGSPGPCLGLLAGSDGDNDPFQEASLDDCEARVKSPIGIVKTPITVLKKTVVT